MNQPHSFCHTEFENHLKCSRSHQRQHLEQNLDIFTEPDTTISSAPSKTFPGTTWLNNPNGIGGGIGAAGLPSNTEPYFVELYPGAAETYGHRQTFMDRFDTNEFSCHRDNLSYYPFTS